jgi:hypothetical protein
MTSDAIEHRLKKVIRDAFKRGIRAQRDFEILCRIELALLGYEICPVRPPAYRDQNTGGPLFRLQGSLEPWVQVWAVIRKQIPAVIQADGTPILQERA